MRVKIALLLLLLAGAVAVSLRLLGPDDDGSEAASPGMQKDSFGYGAGALPDGEWWGHAQGFDVVIQMDGAKGLAAIATSDGDLVFDVEFAFPEVRATPDLDLVVADIDRPTYVFSSSKHVLVWNIAPPDSIAAEDIGTDRDVLDRVTISSVQGTLGAEAQPFSIFRTEVRAPEGRTVGETGVFSRLRALIREERARRAALIESRQSAAMPGDPADRLDLMWWDITSLIVGIPDDPQVRRIAHVMEGMEVVAIGDLMDPAVLGQIASYLGSSWRHAATRMVGRSSDTESRYGFLWDSSAVESVGGVKTYPDSSDAFDRDPAYAGFRTLNGNLDFTLIAVSGSPGSRVRTREAEIRELATVWEFVQAATADDDDLILVGQFLLDITEEKSFAPLLQVPGLIRVNTSRVSTHIRNGTTYDQIFLCPSITSEWTGGWHVIMFDETHFSGDAAAAEEAAGDHRPVCLSLTIPAADDD